MKPEVSVVMPAIRPYNWDAVYKSLEESCTKRSFELIIVSPYPLTPLLQEKRNVKYVKDFGSPVRASCIGAMLCEGDFVYPTHSDDSIFLKSSLDHNIDFLLKQGNEIRNVIVCKYSESKNCEHPDRWQSDEYYKLTIATPIPKKHIPDHWLIFNSAIWHRKYFDTFGGWDCAFEACPMAHSDLAIRAQKDGAIVKLSPHPISMCDHMPDTSGDHAPVHYAQALTDQPLFMKKYSEGLEGVAIKLDPMNWKNAPTVWNRRFSFLKMEFKKEWFFEWLRATIKRLLVQTYRNFFGKNHTSMKG